MAKTNKRERDKAVTTRVSGALEKQIEKYKEHLEKQAPGSQPSTADAVRALIVRGLEAEHADL